MTIDENDFDELSTDIKEIIDGENAIRHFTVEENPTGSWSRFAQVRPSSNTYARAIVCGTEVLEEAGYVTGLRMDHSDTYSHRNVLIDVTITYDVHNRVLDE